MSDNGAVWGENVTEEQKKEFERISAKEKAYINSWEKNEEAGFGSPKTRSPDEKTDFSNLKMCHYGWDFWVKGKPYDVYNIPGYPHSACNGLNELYIVPMGETPSALNIYPFDKDWSPVEWRYEISEIKSWRIKWDEVRTNSGWIGKLYRNNDWFHTVRGRSEENCWHYLITSKLKAEECPLNLFQRDWQEKAVGRKIWYHEKPCVIKHVNSGEGETRLYVVGENEASIDAPASWKEGGEICNEAHWKDSYANGLYVEWDSSDIGWFREGKKK
jgi:hypothetical protein